MGIDARRRVAFPRRDSASGARGRRSKEGRDLVHQDEIFVNRRNFVCAKKPDCGA